MKQKIILQISVVITYLVMIIVNALANILPINNRSTGEISDAYANLFAPAGLTFSIWGLIYLLLGLFIIYQFGIFEKIKIKEKLLNKINLLFIITSIANILWIFSWHYDIIWLSLILMIVLLVTLIKIADIINKLKFSFKEKLFVRLPFSIYFGWITVATIANVTIFLISINWSGFGISESVWTIIILLIGTLIGILRMLKDKNIAYGLVFVWAYIGIYIKHTSLFGFNYQYPSVITTVLVCIGLLLLSIGYLINFKKKLFY
jgi:hypothetical protein